MDGASRADLVLAAEVARRHYLREESKSQIAASLGISRFKVARLLTSARQAGLVRIEVHDPEPGGEGLAEALRAAYDLAGCAVVHAGADGREAVGRRAATELQHLLGSDDVLGLPWSRTVSAMLGAATSLPGVSVVQLCGSLVIPGEDTPVDVVRAAGRLTGEHAHVFYAPLIADDAASATVIRRQPSVAAALRAAEAVTVAVVSIGAWQEGQSTVHDHLGRQEQADAAAAGAVGEVLGILFDGRGRPIATDLARRLVGVTADQLWGVDRVVALADGPAKAEATHALLAGGLVHSLVVGEALARDLLARAGR